MPPHLSDNGHGPEQVEDFLSEHEAFALLPPCKPTGLPAPATRTMTAPAPDSAPGGSAPHRKPEIMLDWRNPRSAMRLEGYIFAPAPANRCIHQCPNHLNLIECLSISCHCSKN